jgi:hypothetical protein
MGNIREPDIREPYVSELVNLYHLAKTAVGDQRSSRMIWAAKAFHKAHPEVPTIQAYKRLDKAIGQKGVLN